MSEKLLTWLVSSFVLITLFITAAVIFIPSVSEAATLIGIILGAYVSLLGGAGVGAYATRRVREDSSRTGKRLADRSNDREDER